ncbi:MAG: putative DNA binding domain-containing protein [Dysgonamonadaceae bacterium]|nr:putative DNA binding domain-containing protein [Dysgonamonadaceae bacterium]
MTIKELNETVRLGETSKVQFKRDLDNSDKIAAEIIAMANVRGGMIIFGVEDKTGNIFGLDYSEIQRISNRIATIANELVKPPVYLTTEAIAFNNKAVLIVYIEEGIAKPYKDNNGTIWIKQGSDKRKLTDNNEQIRLFQQSGRLYVDEITVPNTSEKDIDLRKVEEYLLHLSTYTENRNDIFNNYLYQNLNIIRNNRLTLGGLLFFARNPQRYQPAFCIKAVAFFGNSIGGCRYRDSRDIIGTIPEMFKDGMGFFNAHLLHKQNGQNFNSTGILEISEIALEELLQNALIHRDYTKNSPVRLMLFDNRIEIISPGCLPNSLTIENIKLGQAVARNNLLISYGAKMMIYRGLGSGIARALAHQPDIELINDIEGEQFIVKILRQLQ